ncbi:hypothetical protein AB4142_30090, partial [Variovorax sp. 2RAF20]
PTYCGSSTPAAASSALTAPMQPHSTAPASAYPGDHRATNPRPTANQPRSRSGGPIAQGTVTYANEGKEGAPATAPAKQAEAKGGEIRDCPACPV